MTLVEWMSIIAIGWGGLDLPRPRTPRGWRLAVAECGRNIWRWNGERFIDTGVAHNEAVAR